MLKINRTKDQMGKFSFDGDNAFPRIEKLIEDYWKNKPSVDIERARIYTRSFKETEGEDIIIRRAKAYKEYCETRRIRLPEGQLILGDPGIKPRAGTIAPEFHSDWLKKEIDTISTRKQDPYETDPETIRELKEEIFPYWENKTISAHWIKQVPDYVRELAVKTGIIDTEIKTQSAPGETAPDWEMLFERGIDSLIEEAKGRIAGLDDSNPKDFEKMNFYRASIMTLEGLSTYTRRLGDLAAERAKEEVSPRKEELESMAENCYWLSKKSPATFWQGIQYIWLILVGCLMEGNAASISPGRADQYLFELYKKDIAQGTLTMRDALELIEAFYIKTAETSWFLSENAAMYFAGYQPYHSLIVGGIDKRGVDATNELSYLFLTAKMDVKLHAPSLCVRVHKQSPEEFLQHAAKLARLGTGFPAFYNDECAIKMMLLSGGTIEEARNYQIVGCVEPFIPGKMSKWSDGGHYNFACAMEFVLTNGRSLMNDNRQLGLQTGDPTQMTFEEIKDAVKAQLAYMIKTISICAHVTEKLYYEMTPFPFISTLLDGTYESGKDLTAGGVKYTLGPALIGTGIADLVNSLSAIKKHVFDEKTITMSSLIDAIEHNFEGYEDMRLMLENTTPMYGNDIEEVDLLAGEMMDFVAAEISSHPSWRGPGCISGIYPVSAHIPHGLVVGALPYGRKAGLPLADGCSPKAGTDHMGPTAVLKSVSKINHEAHKSGTLLNMRLDPVSVEGDLGLARITSIIRALVDLNIYHIQFNVISSDLLRRAQENPDKYKSLIVRVAGYSAYFTELCKEVQDDIIQRTVHKA
jgi:pyruvate formate-lyase/glycerol dehydratase family glycyl radical enzyme